MLDAILLTLALAAQSADAALTCRALARGGVELNPFLGGKHATCASVIAMKSGMMIGTMFMPKTQRRWMLGIEAAGGTVGVVLTLKLGPD